MFQVPSPVYGFALTLLASAGLAACGGSGAPAPARVTGTVAAAPAPTGNGASEGADAPTPTPTSTQNPAPASPPATPPTNPAGPADDAGTPPAAPPPIASLTDGQWLKGDLHIHSRHSLDSTNNPVAKIVALGETVGMDYLAITDHDNHVKGDVAHHTWADPQFRSDKLLLLYGAEFTTVRGHASTLSATPYDHQRFYNVRDALDTRVAAVKKELGIHLSANHPATTDHWGYSYDMVDSLEVWNSAIWSTGPDGGNPRGLAIWVDMLNSGRNITLRGGSDSHHGYPTDGAPAQNSIQAGGNNVGTPTTWVFAARRTGQAVIDALTNGRASVSSSPAAPRALLTADLDNDGKPDMMMGDVATASGRPVTFRLTLANAGAATQPYNVTINKNGATLGTFQIQPAAPGVTFTDTPAAGERSYYFAQVEGPQAAYPQVPGAAALSGAMVALTNPVYFNFSRPR